MTFTVTLEGLTEWSRTSALSCSEKRSLPRSGHGQIHICSPESKLKAGEAHVQILAIPVHNFYVVLIDKPI